MPHTWHPSLSYTYLKLFSYRYLQNLIKAKPLKAWRTTITHITSVICIRSFLSLGCSLECTEKTSHTFFELFIHIELKLPSSETEHFSSFSDQGRGLEAILPRRISQQQCADVTPLALCVRMKVLALNY